MNKYRFDKGESVLAASLLLLMTGTHSPGLPVFLGTSSESKYNSLALKNKQLEILLVPKVLFSSVYLLTKYFCT